MILNHNDLIVGLLVDASSEVLQISDENIELAPRVLGNDDDYVSSIGKDNGRIIMILDIGKLLEIVDIEE